MIKDMTYWELRKAVSKIVPRMTQLVSSSRKAEIVREKGRKKNYSQFNLRHREWRKQERLLNTEEINSFLEISVRAAACPMPFNVDVWDGLICPYNCIYCFANSFRASLYTAFFDNSKTMGLRHCNPDYYVKEMTKMEKLRVLPMEEKRKLSGINKAFALDIPVRMGIRFEDFLRNEGRHGVSLRLLEYFKDIEYPVMINTKSDLVAQDAYLRALADNPAKAAVHITMITSNEEIIKKLEPGAPSYAKRLEAIRKLNDAGVRAVPRIEPFLYLLTDEPDYVEQYMQDIWDAGARHITFDTYSYTANNSGLRQNFINEGYDYDRMFEAGCDSQPFGSLLLGKFMQLFRDRGFSCSSFDMGNAPSNDQAVCCEVTDWFKGGWNYGSTVYAARFIADRKGLPTHWKDFEAFVYKRGGFLTEDLRREVKELWNLGGNLAYSHKWAAGMTPTGRDEDGIIWRLNSTDYRETLIKSVI
jgi:DNA repair photolyase